MNIEEIKQFIEQNKEDEQVKQLIEGLQKEVKVDVRLIEKLAEENSEIKSWLDSQKDKHFTKALETWKQNHLEKLINEKIKELNPEKTPEQIELEQIKQKLKQMEQEKLREALKNKALTVAAQKNIPIAVIDFLIGEDEESTLNNLSIFEKAMKSYIDEQVKARINDSSYIPPSDDGDKTTFTKEQIEAMTPEEINKHWDDIKTIFNNQ